MSPGVLHCFLISEVLGLVDKFRPTHGRLWAVGSGLLALGQRGFLLISRQLSSRHFLPSGIHSLVSLQAHLHHPSPRGELLCPSSLILWPSIYHSLKIIVKYTWHKVYQDSLLAQWLRLCISRASSVGGMCSVLWLGTKIPRAVQHGRKTKKESRMFSDKNEMHSTISLT